MYSLDQLLHGLRHPYDGCLEVNRLFSQSVLFRLRPKVDFFEADWDNLVILDACRYDLFAESGIFLDQLEWQWSPGSNSEEFVRYHVTDEPLRDVVWVTANPWVSKYADRIFEVIDVWDDAWDDENDTVPPDAVAAAAMAADAEYPNKRIVAHFMQPHYPFIGAKGDELPNHATFTGDGIRSSERAESTIWELLRNGVVNEDAVWSAYRENLEIALPTVKQLIRSLTGTSIITSDHGNAFGTLGCPIPVRIYGHPSGLRYESLVKVPWVVHPGEQRKHIEPGQIRSHDENVVERQARLADLGYLSK